MSISSFNLLVSQKMALKQRWAFNSWGNSIYLKIFKEYLIISTLYIYWKENFLIKNSHSCCQGFQLLDKLFKEDIYRTWERTLLIGFYFYFLQVITFMRSSYPWRCCSTESKHEIVPLVSIKHNWTKKNNLQIRIHREYFYENGHNRIFHCKDGFKVLLYKMLYSLMQTRQE